MSGSNEYEPGILGSVRSELVKLGFKFRELPRDGAQLRYCRLSKKLEGVEPVCLFNEDLVFEIHLRIFGTGVPGETTHFNVEYSLKGGIVGGGAAEVKIYGGLIDCVVPDLPDVERRLIAAWKAIAG